MAVLFSAPLDQLVEVKRPVTVYGHKHVYNYIIGPSLEEALTKSVEAAYSNVSVLKVVPSIGEFERFISFSLQSSRVIVEFIPGYLQQEAKVTAVVDVKMEVIDGSSLKTIRQFKLQGKVASSKDVGDYAHASKYFSSAMEDAVRQLVEKASRLLISGAAEPGWKGQQTATP